jgi:hypothetical protein
LQICVEQVYIRTASRFKLKKAMVDVIGR